MEGVNELTTLIATPNHPFWIDIPLVHDEHWLAAMCLEPGHVLQMADRRKGTVHAVGRVHRTQYPQVGFAGDDRVGVGIVLDLSGKQPKIADAQMLGALDKLEIKEPYLTPVYNFTVEEFHTYYVGEVGVWVHNSECGPGEALSATMLKTELEGTCFHGDTFVLTLGGNLRPDGTWSAPIEQTEVGEYVLSRCELTGETAYKRVTRVFAHGLVKVCRLICDYDSHLPGTSPRLSTSILATAEHPFWVQGKGWVPVRDLQPGDEFVTYNGIRAALRKVELDVYEKVVFNLEVEDFHTYFVESKGIWVHNKSPIKPCFPIDTLVAAKGGQWAEIDRLGVGALVLSRCEKTGEQAYRRVVKKFVHATEGWDSPPIPLYKVTFATADGKKDAVDATAKHPFWVNGMGWVAASELVPGQMLEICDQLGIDDCDRPMGMKSEDLIFSGQRWQAEVVSVLPLPGCQIVYNIEVEEFHTYFVGAFGVWVHNKNQK